MWQFATFVVTPANISKGAEKAGEISANELDRAEKEIERITHEHVEMIDKAFGRKEQELLEV